MKKAGTNVNPAEPSVNDCPRRGRIASPRNPDVSGALLTSRSRSAFFLNELDHAAVRRSPWPLIMHYGGGFLREERYLTAKFGEPLSWN